MNEQEFRPGGPVERFTPMMFTRTIADAARSSPRERVARVLAAIRSPGER